MPMSVPTRAEIARAPIAERLRFLVTMHDVTGTVLSSHWLRLTSESPELLERARARANIGAAILGRQIVCLKDAALRHLDVIISERDEITLTPVNPPPQPTVNEVAPTLNPSETPDSDELESTQ